jgi:hypothetical protein
MLPLAITEALLIARPPRLPLPFDFRLALLVGCALARGYFVEGLPFRFTAVKWAVFERKFRRNRQGDSSAQVRAPKTRL